MDERIGSIAAALNQTDMDWTCRFETTLWIGDIDYKIVVSDGGDCVEVKAWLPEHTAGSRFAAVERRIAKINEDLSCGSFGLDGMSGEITYRIYDLTDGAPISVQRMHALLNRCRDALEQYGEELCGMQESTGSHVMEVFDKLFSWET